MTHVAPQPGLSGGALVVAKLMASLTMLGSCLVMSVGSSPAVGASSLAGLLPVLVVHAWSIVIPGALPVSIVFAAGLWVDAMSHGPLGFWALAYVVAALASDALGSVGRRGSVGHAASIAATLGVVVGVVWLSASVYGERWVPAAGLLLAGMQAGLIYIGVAGCVSGMLILKRWQLEQHPNKRREAWP